MTDQDNLRDRIASLIEGLDDQQMIDDGKLASPDDIAQAIIDELGLRVEGQMGVDGEDPIWEERVAGKWEAERCPR